MLNKILLTVILIAVVWFGFKYWSRVQEVRRRQLGEARRQEPGPVDGGPVEDMAKCPVCAAYVPARGARSCGRPDCPYRG